MVRKNDSESSMIGGVYSVRRYYDIISARTSEIPDACTPIVSLKFENLPSGLRCLETEKSVAGIPGMSSPSVS
ncbi:hypothetical protein PHLCEN_2v12583 [Hermanssonia centrifuga]|uniref:Uncharacterized protein n=1 Tax=Hermanssonia centrifuga TaxID=98765 RepID=A0A2R6NHS3_9APHY|nr:hypothetical protein PHLCEN_2v12583 [Hermanssonia centrifuga]